ncbi:ComF family protein [Ferrimonas sp. YFM]|uniref:ComF family protein n=1 Tax=Ferrimonas sp. YFM TaxID=3028878 RepID=UPI0025722E0D|nr:ComF family protein [Ferrimonas sp. YFM]BDY03138.1 amidophosphoribosyltransferase [Ferrimonas sp. YFM]
MLTLSHALSSILAASLPNRCTLCQQPLARGAGLCDVCLADGALGQVCLHCHRPLELAPPHRCGSCLTRKRWRPVVSAFHYHGPIGPCVARIKAHGQPQLVNPLAKVLASRIQAYHDQGHLPLPQALVPVPTHASRLQQLGFNPAWLVAQALSRELTLPLLDQLVVKARPTRLQHQLDGQARRDNLRDAFSLAGEGEGQQVALVDDIITTGSTLKTVTRTLGQAGVRVTQFWTLASALNRR